MSTNSLNGQVAIVTGAASGIGLAIAKHFAAAGATVIIADNQVEKGQEAAKKIAGAHFNELDVTKEEQVKGLIDAVISTYGGLHILVNNAGVDAEQKTVGESDSANWHHVLDVNLNGVYYGMKHALPHFAAQQSGVILNTASIGGQVAFVKTGSYGVAKAGVIQLTKIAALEYAPMKVRVNAICPTIVGTALVEHFINSNPDPAATRTWFENFNPYPGMVTVDAVAEAALYLCSPASSFVTGIALTIDGGYTIQ